MFIVMFIYYISYIHFALFAYIGPEKPQWGVANYIYVYIFYLLNGFDFYFGPFEWRDTENQQLK